MKGSTVLLVVLVLAATYPARATTYQRMALDDLTASSQTVVYGKVVAKHTEWNQQRTLIYTVYAVQPLQYLKGRLGPIFELHEPGGTKDSLGVHVAGVPTFEVGEEAVLFVWTGPSGKHQVTGFELGTFRVRTDPASGLKMVNRSVPLGSARGERGTLTAVPATSRWLPQLFDQIQRSAAKARTLEATR